MLNHAMLLFVNVNIVCQLGFFGSGVMAEAILRGLLSKDIVKPSDVWTSDMYEFSRRFYLLLPYFICLVVANLLNICFFSEMKNVGK